MTRKALDQILPDVVERLKNALKPSTVLLYGSCARGDFRAGSDIDLLIVVPHSSDGFFARTGKAYRALRGVPVPVDVQVYTRDEFESRAALPISFERTVLEEGQVLYAA